MATLYLPGTGPPSRGMENLPPAICPPAETAAEPAASFPAGLNWITPLASGWPSSVTVPATASRGRSSPPPEQPAARPRASTNALLIYKLQYLNTLFLLGMEARSGAGRSRGPGSVPSTPTSRILRGRGHARSNPVGGSGVEGHRRCRSIQHLPREDASEKSHRRRFFASRIGRVPIFLPRESVAGGWLRALAGAPGWPENP